MTNQVIEPKPKEICIEDLDLEPEDERYLRCVALADAAPGLALDREGVVRWMPEGPVAYGLWVSADDRLMLERGEGCAPIVVERAGRSVEAPPGQPVVLLDQDLLLVSGRRLRIHIHGDAEEIVPPEPVFLAGVGRAARAAAAAVSLGAAALAGAPAAAAPLSTGPAPIEVRKRPPKPAPRYTYITCAVSGFKRAKNELEVHATCPVGAKIRVGLRGDLLGEGGRPIPGGSVQVTRVSKRRVVARTNLKKAPEAKQVRFRLPRYGGPLGL